MSVAIFSPDDDDARPATPAPAPAGTPVLPLNAGARPAKAPLVAPASVPGNAAPAGTPVLPLKAGARPASAMPVAPATVPGNAAPVYLPVVETPPVRSRPFKRPPPTLGRVAPLPDVARTRTAGQWVARYSALTTASDPRSVLQVGINVLVELRQEQRRAAPIGGLERLASARLLKPLWSQPALREETAGVLAVLEQEVIELVEALELVPIVQRGPGWELLEAARTRAIAAHWERLEEIVAVLRQQVRQRGAVRRLAGVLTGLAWKALVTLAA